MIKVDNGRFFKQLFLLVCVNQMASALFRLTAAAGRSVIVANTFGSCALIVVLVLGGFILSRGREGTTSTHLVVRSLLLIYIFLNNKIFAVSSAR